MLCGVSVFLCVQFHKTGRLSKHIQAIGFFRKENVKSKIGENLKNEKNYGEYVHF